KPISTKTFPLSVEVPADKTYRVVAERRGYDSFEKEVSFTGGSSEQRVTIELSAAEDTSSRSSRTASAPARTPSTSQTSSAPSQASSSSKGTLNINSIPVSTVILDGRPLGQTPKVGVSVSPGSHTVVFVHPEHGRKVRAVTVQAGQTATAAVRFPCSERRCASPGHGPVIVPCGPPRRNSVQEFAPTAPGGGARDRLALRAEARHGLEVGPEDLDLSPRGDGLIPAGRALEEAHPILQPRRLLLVHDLAQVPH